MDSATVRLLRMEAMGTEGLPRTAQAWRVHARSGERQQERDELPEPATARA